MRTIERHQVDFRSLKEMDVLKTYDYCGTTIELLENGSFVIKLTEPKEEILEFLALKSAQSFIDKKYKTPFKPMKALVLSRYHGEGIKRFSEIEILDIRKARKGFRDPYEFVCKMEGNPGKTYVLDYGIAVKDTKKNRNLIARLIKHNEVTDKIAVARHEGAQAILAKLDQLNATAMVLESKKEAK